MSNIYLAAASAYGRAKETRGDLATVVEIYDRILVSLHRARLAREGNRFDVEFQLVQTVIRALTGLRGRLNHKRGGTVALTLEKFYSRLIIQLQLRHRAQDKVGFYVSLEKQVTPMRDAWSQLAGREERGTAGG